MVRTYRFERKFLSPSDITALIGVMSLLTVWGMAGLSSFVKRVPRETIIK
jgi:hypothetical protein